MPHHDTPSVRIPLHSRKYPGLFAVVDADDAPLVLPYRWNPAKRGLKFYATANAVDDSGNRTQLLMHRVIAGATTGDGVDVDHWDHDGLNNRRCNLRVCTRQQNARHQRKTGGVSRFKGVSPSATAGKWVAHIRFNNRKVHIGTFLTEEDAARAYDVLAMNFYGEFANLNFSSSDASGLTGSQRI